MSSVNKGVVTFENQPPEGTINLGIGQPSADLLPLDLVRRASGAFFANAQSIELNYGVVEGDARFLASLATFLTASNGVEAAVDELFLTSGNSCGMDLASVVFAKAGDTVFVEEPSYFLAFQVFRDHGLEVVGIPIDDDGLRVDALQTALEMHKPAFLYTIPSFHNPGGQSTSAERRERIVELAREHDFLVLADEVYQLLYYYDPPPPAYGSMARSGAVVSLGSFSKILAPGLRLGWIQTAPDLRRRLMNNGSVNSGGSLNQFVSHVVRQAIDSGELDTHLVELRRRYRARLEAMDEALRQHFSGIAHWTRPDGGYFFWLQFDESVDTAAFREKARALETGYQPGVVFSPRQQFSHCLRLCFAHYNEDDIAEGIARMRPLFD